MAHDAAEGLGIELEFLSASQDTHEGQAMREWIVSSVKALDREKMLTRARNYTLS